MSRASVGDRRRALREECKLLSEAKQRYIEEMINRTNKACRAMRIYQSPEDTLDLLRDSLEEAEGTPEDQVEAAIIALNAPIVHQTPIRRYSQYSQEEKGFAVYVT
jgi:hypothetical protein